MKKHIVLLIALILFAAPVFSQNGKKAKPNSRAKAPANKPAAVMADDDAPPPAPEPPKAKRAAPRPADEPPPPPPVKQAIRKQKPSSDVLKEETIGEWSVASLLIPADLIDKNVSTEEKTNKNVSWTSYLRAWKQPFEYDPSALEVDLRVTTWNNPIKEVIPELREDLATPEHLILLDQLGDLKSKNTPGSFVTEAKAMDIGGINGSYFRAVSPIGVNRFMIGWTTHRYYNGKPQRISLTVSGADGELEKAIKILNSLKLQPAD